MLGKMETNRRVMWRISSEQFVLVAMAVLCERVDACTAWLAPWSRECTPIILVLPPECGI
jgi:hypothetical protein